MKDTVYESIQNTDSWGNIRIEPVKTLCESHGKDTVTILIYQLVTSYYFGFKLLVGKTVRQKRANINDPPFETIESAQKNAVEMIIKICKENQSIKRLSENFMLIYSDQPELF